MREIIALLIFIIVAQITSAAIIQGTVYDWELNPEIDTVIEINTTPKQTIVSKDGDYMITLSTGFYAVKAKTTDGTETVEQIEIIDDGVYNLDIIVLGIESPDDLYNESDFQIEEDLFPQKNILITYTIAAVALIILALSALLIFKIRKKEKEIKHEVHALKTEIKHKEVDAELKKVVDAIKQAGGRTTQKDLRKQFPSSEAKISLMISELEQKGIVEKIKKGRGNIIILK